VTRIEVLQKIRADLEWRGPNGNVLGNIVLPRAAAEALLNETEAEAILVAMFALSLRLHELIREREEEGTCQSS
jgi:hypothetical protein